MNPVKTETVYFDEHKSCGKIVKTYVDGVLHDVYTEEEEFHGLCKHPACSNLDDHCGCAHTARTIPLESFF